MIERQKVVPMGSGVIYLVLVVITFHSEGAGPLSDIDVKTFAYRKDVSAIDLIERAIDLGPRLIGWVSLQRLRGLAPLQVQTGAPALCFGRIGGTFDDQGGLVQAEAVTRHVIGTK